MTHNSISLLSNFEGLEWGHNHMANEKNDTINVPYINAYGSLTKALERIKNASTPARFTQDFLATKLNLSGGSARPIIPFLKRTGFLNGDGTPTDLYKEFRNDALRKSAVARAVKIGYSTLYDIHEYAHDLGDKELKGVVVQATGLDANSTTVKAILGSFKALCGLADFEIKDEAFKEVSSTEEGEGVASTKVKKEDAEKESSVNLKLGYTINLNLPATSDIAVFNAIFKSLKDHLLD